MCREQPFVQRNMRTAENRICADGEFVAAVVAKEHTGLRLAAHLVDVERTTERAVNPVGPAIGLHVGRGLGFVVKDRVCEVYGHRYLLCPVILHPTLAKSSA